MRIINGKHAIIDTCNDILYDESRMNGAVPLSVYFPENATELRSVIVDSANHKQKITFSGGRTGTTGGSVPTDDSIVISFSMLTRILQVTRTSSGELIVVCEPGITLSTINTFLGNINTWPYLVPGTELIGSDTYCYLPDPTEMTAQLGGTVATNASGARSFKFGATRSHIASLSLIFPSGDTLSLERGKFINTRNQFTITTDQGNCFTIDPFDFVTPDVKNAAGYFVQPTMDLIDLFIGSEGTLAAFASIGIRIQEKPRFVSGCTFFSSRTAAFAFADFLSKDTQIASIEFFDESALTFIEKYRQRFPDEIPEFPPAASQAILWEFISDQPDSFDTRYAHWEEQLQQYGSSFENTWSGMESAESERLKRFRHALPEMINATVAAYKVDCNSIRKIGTDTALPAKVFVNIYEQYLREITGKNLTYAAFGHLGDFHIHINILPSNKEELQDALDVYDVLMKLTIANKGTISAEHGIGKLKKKYLLEMYGKSVSEQMKKIKNTFDPDWRFNPGTLIEK